MTVRLASVVARACRRSIAGGVLVASAALTGCGLLPASSRERRRIDVGGEPGRELAAPFSILGPTAEVTSGTEPAFASSGPIGLRDVLASVSRAHPLLVAALQEQEIAAGRFMTAEGAYDLGLRGRAVSQHPSNYESFEGNVGLEQLSTLWGTSFSGGYRISDGKFAIYDGKRKTNLGGEVRLGARVPLLRDGPIDRARASLRQAEVDQDLADMTIARQRIELARRASRDYWGWVAAGKRLGVAESLLRIAEERDAAIAIAAERGDIPELERADNQRLIASRRALFVAARRGLELAAIDLSLWVRDRDGSPVVLDRTRLPASFPEPEAPDLAQLPQFLRQALEARPDVRRLLLLQEKAQVELDLAENQLLPGLDLTVNASQDVRGDKDRDKRVFELEAGLNLDLPIERRAAKGRQRTARAQLTSLKAEERFARDRIAADIQDALSAMRAAQDRLRQARRNVELARQLESAERISFQLGQSTLLIVNLREQAAADAAALEVEALADFHRAAADLQAALGAWGEEPK